MAKSVLVIGVAQKAAGDTNLRLAISWADEPLLKEGYSITSQGFSTSGTGAPTIAGVQKDNSYQTSARFSGGTAGTTYTVVATVTLDDPDATTLSRSCMLEIV